MSDPRSLADSIMNVLFNIVLAFYVLRISFAYFSVPFASGLLLQYMRRAHAMPIYLVMTPSTEPSLIPLQLVVTAAWARYVVSFFRMPRTLRFRLLVGLVAAGYAVTFELFTVSLLRHEGRGFWIASLDRSAALCFATLLLGLAAMPTLVMVTERRGAEKEEEEEQGAATAPQDEKSPPPYAYVIFPPRISYPRVPIPWRVRLLSDR